MSLPGNQPNPWSREGHGTPSYPPPPPPYSPPPRRRRVTLWVGLGVLVAAVVGAALWGAIAEIRSTDSSAGSAPGSGQNKVVTASDNKSQLTVPVSWKDVPATVQNELAAIQLGDLRREQYVLVITAAKGDFDGFEGFSEAIVEEATTLLDDTDVGDRRSITIGGLPAVQHQITGKTSGLKIVFWYTMVEGENAYYQVVAWTLPSRQSEAEPIITEVINSFRELGAT